MISSPAKSYLLFFAVLFGLFILLYSKVIVGLYHSWMDDPNYSHGFLVPFISAYFAWRKRDRLAELDVRPAFGGLLVVLFGVFVLFAGIAAQEFYTRRASMIIILAGCLIFLLGWNWLKALALPIIFLFFMIPLPYIVYDAIAFPLKLFVAKFSVATLQAIGVIVIREGNIIIFPNITLEVADACSGLRSLMSLLAMSVALAVTTQVRNWAMVLVVILAIPVAIFTNMIRVIVTGFLAQYYGTAVAEGFFHEFAGMSVFVLAMVMMILLSGAVRKLSARRVA